MLCVNSDLACGDVGRWEKRVFDAMSYGSER